MSAVILNGKSSGRRVIRRRVLTADAAPSLPATAILQRLYHLRGVRSADELDLGLERLIPIRALDGVGAAVELLLDHYRRRSRILIVGDFDTDGATSTALTVRQLRR